MYYKFSIPKRIDDRGWAALESLVREFNRELQTAVLKRLGKNKARLEQILGSQRMPAFRRRRLERRLVDVESRRSSWLRW